ncbi:HYR domain-containing protein [Winogradskyella sp.]|uniref:HYR domain-containing protein n=1 Tax=Winogradskyella sp. TaxID=1883156 RepID=UPI003BA9025E
MKKLTPILVNLWTKTYKVQYNRSIIRLLTGLLCLAPFMSYGQTTWYLDNVVFDDGSVAAGSFDYNPLGGVVQYTNISITSGISSIYGIGRFDTVAAFSTDPTTVQFFEQSSSNYTGAPTMVLNFNQSLVIGSGIINLTGFTGTCTNANCNGIVNPISFTASGRIRTNVPPTAVCQDITVALDANGNASITPEMIDGGSTDDIAGFSLLSTNFLNFTCADLGANTITLTILDFNGASDSCEAIVTVEDISPPVFSPILPITVNNDLGSCGANVTVPVPSVSDNCSFTLTNSFNNTSDASGFYPIGTTVLVWTATDPSGNTTRRSQFININDAEPASVTCPADVVVTNDSGLCTAMVAVPQPVATDNCPFTLIDNSFNGTADASGEYPVGTTVVNWSLVEASGTIINCTQSVTVNDTEVPTITCSSDIIITNDAGLCSASVIVPPPTTADNCSVASVTNDFNDTNDASGNYPAGTTLVTWTVTDTSGNTNTCTQAILVGDLEVPSIDCSGAYTINGFSSDEMGVCSAWVTVPEPVVSDNCSVASVTNDFNNTSDASGIYPLGVTTVVWTVTDALGSSNTCMQTITVNDTEAPLISCSADITMSNTLGQCGALVSVPLPTVTDNCSFTLTNDFTNSDDASTVYPIGTTLVTWTATDPSGNTNTCTQNITVNDTENPTISCPDLTVGTDMGMCNAIVTVPAPTVSDNCSVASFTNDFNNSSDASGTYTSGTTVVIWTVTDTAGNINTCTQNIIVNDTEPPTITCPADIDVNTEPGLCGATITVPQPTFSDNCPSVTITNDFTNTSDASGTYPGGITTVTWTATDAAGNTTACTQQIFVDDIELPIVSCSAVNVNVPAGQCSAMVTVPAPTVSDNCSISSVTNEFNGTSDASGIYNVGTTVFRWVVVDSRGWTTYCNQSVTVTESIPPSILCPDDITVSCAQVVNYNPPSATENCGFQTVPTSVPNFTLLGTFGNSTYFVSNFQAHSGATVFSLAADNGYDLVTINTAEENAYIVQALRSAGIGGIFLGYNDLQTEGTFVWQSGQPSFYENWEEGQPEDDSFNSNAAEDYVRLLPFTGTWYDVIDDTSAHIVIEFHDYSNGMPIQVAGLPSGSFFTKTTVNTFYSKDASGNESTCAVTVTVEDTEGPTMSCPADIAVNADVNSCSAAVNIPIPNMITDVCGATLIPSTGKVSYNFSAIALIDTPATLYNATTTLEDVQLNITYNGDHDGLTENFVLVGPDSVTLLNESEGENCQTTTRTVVIPTATWNTWVTTYGANLTFTLLANPDVNEEVCFKNVDDFFRIDAVNQGVLALTNDFNNSPDASDVYPIGTTTITWTITDLAENSTTCTQNITVTETEPPVISCPGNITVNTDPDLCSAVVTYNAPTVTDNCTTNSLQNVLNNFNQNNQQITSLIPNAYNFDLDVGVNSYYIDDGGGDMYDDGNFITTDINPSSIYYSDNTIVRASSFGTNGVFFTRKVDHMWLLAADLDNVNTFDITGNLGADGSGLADGFTATIMVEGVNYNLFVKRVREDTTVNNDSDPSVNHLIIIPENANAAQNFATDTDDNQHQVTGLLGTTRLYYLLFASDNSGLVDNNTMEAIATSFITNTFSFPGTIVQTAGLASGSAFPVGATTNTFIATDESGNSSTCSFTVTVNDTSGNCNVLVSPKVYLQGSSLNSTIASDGLMRDDLRAGNYIPLNTPYTDNTSINSSVLNVTGADAIVDWVWVELRDANTNTTVIDGKSALLQRDGDVVALDGSSAVMFGQLAGNYHVVIKHRNHLGIMSSSAIALSSTTTIVDFSNGSTTTFGSDAQTTSGLPNGTFALWVGDSNGDAVIQYVGGIQDTPGILAEVLNDNGNFLSLPTFVTTGYSNRDINMDGNIQYVGGNSELPFILQNVLDDPRNFLNLSTWPINAQLPTTTVRAMQLRNQFERSKF